MDLWSILVQNNIRDGNQLYSNIIRYSNHLLVSKFIIIIIIENLLIVYIL